MSDETAIVQRLHITFGKFGALKFTGNLDIAKVWERVLRRADLPLLYTQGFNTRPRMQLASALPLGITSECEILDVALREYMPSLDGLPERIMDVSPAGLVVYDVKEINANHPAPQTLLRSAEYRIHFVDPVDVETLQARVDDLLVKDRIIKEETGRKKRRKSVTDLRPMLYDLRVDTDGDLLAHLAAGERGNLRPDEVVRQLALDDHHTRIHRYAMHLEDYEFHTRLSARERQRGEG